MSERRLDERPLLQNHPLAWRLSLILWAIGGLLFVALAVPSTDVAVQNFDDRVWRLAVEWENGFFVGLAKTLDFLGSAWVVTPLIFGVAVFLGLRRQWERFWFWAAAMVVSQLLIGPIKALYERERPPLPLVETSGFSFPSGHAVAGSAVAVSLVIVLVRAGPKRRNLEVLAALFALLMATSRVYLRAHWLTDVVAGAALGIAVAIGVAALIHYIDERRGRKAAPTP